DLQRYARYDRGTCHAPTPQNDSKKWGCFYTPSKLERLSVSIAETTRSEGYRPTPFNLGMLIKRERPNFSGSVLARHAQRNLDGNLIINVTIYEFWSFF